MTASIIPFAQGEMVVTFMEGIDPAHREALNGYIAESHDVYRKFIENQIRGNPREKKLKNEIRKASKQSITELKKKMEGYCRQYQIDPIINTVAHLPKDELAAMAESLVHLTALKRKITLKDTESVGGPIDVAIISKGDGFIWIKRKHYFRPELNSHFLANYNRGI